MIDVGACVMVRESWLRENVGRWHCEGALSHEGRVSRIDIHGGSSEMQHTIDVVLIEARITVRISGSEIEKAIAPQRPRRPGEPPESACIGEVSRLGDGPVTMLPTAADLIGSDPLLLAARRAVEIAAQPHDDPVIVMAAPAQEREVPWGPWEGRPDWQLPPSGDDLRGTLQESLDWMNIRSLAAAKVAEVLAVTMSEGRPVIGMLSAADLERLRDRVERWPQGQAPRDRRDVEAAATIAHLRGRIEKLEQVVEGRIALAKLEAESEARPAWTNIDGMLHSRGDTTYCSCSRTSHSRCPKCGGLEHTQGVYGGLVSYCENCDPWHLGEPPPHDGSVVR